MKEQRSCQIRSLHSSHSVVRMILLVMMLLVSKVYSSQSFALRSTKVLITPVTTMERGFSLKSSKEMIKNYLKRNNKGLNTIEEVKSAPPVPRPSRTWNPLSWFVREAHAVTTPTTGLLPSGRRVERPSIKEKYKLISDVDDTIVSSGGLKLFGIKLGGVDNRYKRGQFYPGVVQFALELSKSGHSSSSPSAAASINVTEIHHRLPSKVAVLTARPRELQFALALRPSHKLNKRYSSFGETSGFPGWGIGDVYYGSVMEWIFHHRKGLRKFQNFEIMLKNDDARHEKYGSTHHLPLKYILLGDTGEKDEEAGERMAAKYPDRVSAVFLHTVYNIHDPPSFTSDSSMPKDRRVNGVPIYYFRTYVGAAIKAYQNNLINQEAVQRITQKAIHEMKELDQYSQKDYQRKMKFLANFPPQKEKNEKLQQQFEQVRRLRWQELKKDIDSCSFLRSFLASTPATAVPDFFGNNVRSSTEKSMKGRN